VGGRLRPTIRFNGLLASSLTSRPDTLCENDLWLVCGTISDVDLYASENCRFFCVLKPQLPMVFVNRDDLDEVAVAGWLANFGENEFEPLSICWHWRITNPSSACSAWLSSCHFLSLSNS
jgi:hypothetical protein